MSSTATDQTGTYFKTIYADLMEKSQRLPDSDPSPNLQDCIKHPNFVRAQMLALQHSLPADIVTHLRELAIMQYFLDYKNGPGLQKLAEHFNLSPSDRVRLIGLIMQEKEYPCFSFSKNTEIAALYENSGAHQVLAWAQTQRTAERTTGRRTSILTSLIRWIKQLLSW